MAKGKNAFDRFADRVENCCDKLLDELDRPAMVTEPVHQWWFVSNATHTGMVITDPERRIVTAPIVWNQYIGIALEDLLERVHAKAVKIPGPQGKQRWA